MRACVSVCVDSCHHGSVTAQSYDCGGNNTLVTCHQASLQGPCQDRESLGLGVRVVYVWVCMCVLDDAGR